MKKKYVIHALLFLFCFTIIFGNAFNTTKHYKGEWNVDVKSYTHMAAMDYQVKPTHRYRVIIPTIVYLMHEIVVFISPSKSAKLNNKEGEHYLINTYKYYFLIVNTFFLSLAGMALFYGCNSISGRFSAFLVLIAFLTSKFTNYSAGIPVTDSLYLLLVVILVFSVWNKNKTGILLCLLLGPIAKESFLIFSVYAFIFSNYKKEVLVAMCTGVLLYVLTRFSMDLYFPNENGYYNIYKHLYRIPKSISRLFSLRGFAELFFVVSSFHFVVIYTLISKKGREYLNDTLPIKHITFLGLICLLTILLSTNVGRMYYLSFPLIALFLTKSFHYIIRNELKYNDLPLKL